MAGDERKDRKAALRAWRDQERERAIAELPGPLDVMRGLFGFLEDRLDDGCDHSLRFTVKFASDNGLDETKLSEWAERFGGYCDCEVLYNVKDSNPAFSR